MEKKRKKKEKKKKEKETVGTGEMTQYLKALAALVEDQGLVQSTHMWLMTKSHAQQFWACGCPVQDSAGTLHTCGALLSADKCSGV